MIWVHLKKGKKRYYIPVKCAIDALVSIGSLLLSIFHNIHIINLPHFQLEFFFFGGANSERLSSGYLIHD